MEDMEKTEAKFSPKKTSSKRNCCVPQCSSKAFLNPELRFHSFPKKGEFVLMMNAWNVRERSERRKVWIRMLKIGKPVSNNMFVCSRHFFKSDYILPDFPAAHRHLKKTAIPSLNLPITPTEARIMAKGANFSNRRRSRDKNEEPMTDGLPEVAEEPQLEEEGRIALAADALMSLRATTPLLTPRPSSTIDTGIQCSVDKRDFSCQVSAGDLKVPFVDVIDSPKKLATFTGLHSFEKLAGLIYIFTALFPHPNKNALDTKSKVIMTFMKLKLNWSFAVLSTLFSVSPTTCKNIFTQCVYTLSEICRSSIEWPSIEEIRNNLPKCFEKFKKVRVVLDCTEIKIAKFRCLKCRILSYSHYKGNHTVKYMIGVTPGGTISFVSNGYGGRASDKRIFEESGIINLLEPYIDEVMADKGFLIRTICQENFIGLIHPPFLRNKTKFSKEEALLTSGIAKARVHVERAIERVKKFKILSDAFPPTLIPLIDDIMIIACGMTNMSNPILADDKFL